MYLNKTSFKMKVKKFQQGGAPAPAGQPGPEEQLMAMAQELISQLGPEAAAMLAQAILEMLQGGGAGAPEAPVYAKRGGKLVRVKK